MRPAKVLYTCESCGHEGEGKGQCARHLPDKERKRTTANWHQPKRTYADAKWSKAVRDRDGNACVRCGKATGQLDAAHIVRRGRKALRKGYDKHTGDGCCLRHTLSNAVTLCAWKCHRWYDEQATDEERRVLVDGHLGEGAFDEMMDQKKVNK